jgi:2'-5' RNA ligase
MSAAEEQGSVESRPRGPSRQRGGRWAAPVDPPGVLRLFFAVPVPGEARDRVGELIDRVQREVGDGTARIRWVRVEGLHLTLRFLGPTPEDRVEPLRAAAEALARAAAPFEVELSGGGAFPSLARPRSLWVGVQDGAERLASLADALTGAAGECGLVLDTRPFAPHLTIGRTDGVRLGPVAARALEHAADGLEVRFEVDRFILFRSFLGGGPARYEALHEARLGG